MNIRTDSDSEYFECNRFIYLRKITEQDQKSIELIRKVTSSMIWRRVYHDK